MIALLLAAGVAASAAHPLGNFSVNRYDGLVVAPHELRIDHVQDLAEIPAAQVLQDGADLPGWAARECARSAAAFRITGDGRPVAAAVRSSSATARPGQAGLRTLRLECRITAPFEGARLGFRDTGAGGRVGWHEVTAAGDRMTLSSSDVPGVSRTARLTRYPEDALGSPLDTRAANAEVRPGGPALAAPSPGGGADQVLPRGADRLTRAFTGLVARHHLTPGFAVTALLIAMVLGAAHALAPGHGKTIMAAQAAVHGRRSRREVLGLGLTVTVTHTAGVLVLGLLIASGSSLGAPQVFPWLGAAGGLLVAVAGVTLLRRALRQGPGHSHGHGHGQTHGHGHGQTHGHGHGRPREGRWRSMLLMGFAGGLLPSPSAIVVLLGANALGHAWFGVLLVLAYGAGLAVTLVSIGMLVSGSGRLLARRLPSLRALAAPRLLPAGTAALVVLLGVGLAARSLAPLLA